MPSQKLVRCEVQRPGEPVASTRFIPLESQFLKLRDRHA